MRRRPAERADLFDRAEPAFDHRLFVRITLARRPEAPQRRDEAQRQVAESRIAAQLQRERELGLALPASRRVPGQHPLRPCQRQRSRHLGEARLEEVVDGHELVAARADLGADAGVARVARLQVGHAHDVVERHPQREEARGLAGQRMPFGPGRIDPLLEREDAPDAFDVEVRVASVLVVDQAVDAVADHRADAGGPAVGRQSDRGHRRRHRRGIGQVRPGERMAKAALEAVEARVDSRVIAEPGRADRGLAVQAAERQQSRTGDRAEHHRADHRPRGARFVVHVEADMATAVRDQHIEQPPVVLAAVAHRDLLAVGQRARRRRDHRRPPAIDIAGLRRAHRLEQLRRDQQVDAPGHRREVQDRPPAAERRGRLRMDLDVIGRRAGALCDPGDRRALDRVAGVQRGLDQPLRQHAAAFAAERRDQDRDRRIGPHLAARDRIGPPQRPRVHARARRATDAVVAHARSRSQRVGLRTTSMR